MKKTMLAVSIISIMGAGSLFASNRVAGAQVVEPNYANTKTFNLAHRQQMDRICETFSTEDITLIESGYATLTDEEKAFFNEYYRTSKSSVTEEQLTKYEEIHNKIYQYAPEEIQQTMLERQSTREERQVTNQSQREERQANNKGTGNQQRKGANAGRNNVECEQTPEI